MTRLYKNIKKYREKLGYTQQQLAFLTGYTDRTSIAKIEAGKIDLPLSKIDLFARALKTDPSALLGWNTELLVGAPIEKFSVSQRIPLLGDIACGEPIYADENFSSHNNLCFFLVNSLFLTFSFFIESFFSLCHSPWPKIMDIWIFGVHLIRRRLIFAMIGLSYPQLLTAA